MKTCSLLEEIITLNEVVFKDVESDMAVRIRKRGYPTQKTSERQVTV